MIKTSLSKGWRLTSPVNNNDEIDLPDDFSIRIPRSPSAPGGGANGFYIGGVGRYTKYFDIPDDAEHILLNVEGAYSQSEVRFNSDVIYQHHHGYTPFLVDLSDRARRGLLNRLEIKVNDVQPSTRWYSGAGLYRDVYLWTGGRVRIEPWDCFISTTKIKDGRAELKISYTITSDVTDIAQITGYIVSPSGESEAFALCANVTPGKTQADITVFIDNAELWDTETPNLYTLNTTVELNGEVTDTAENVFGIRTISADPYHGFRLNGKTLKLRGGCLHHTHGALGAADFPDAVERQIKKLKSAGYNAIRSAHNPPSLNLLETCDRLGVILMDEAFDMWREQKNENDYHLWFEYCWAADIARMVKRDRNHPCVVSYSIGNEILERGGLSDGGEWAAKLSAEIRKYDKTKLVTSGVCGLWGGADKNAPEEYRDFDECKNPWGEEAFTTATAKYCEPLDIVGYNYLHYRYEIDHKLFPNRVIWGSETYAITFYDSWKAVMDNSHVIGDFCWTCYDNLGENGTGRWLWARDGEVKGISLAGYEWISCFQGDFDLAGFRRPQSYFREAIWKGCTVQPRIFTTHPEHYGEGFTGTGWHFYDVHETWTFADEYIGRPVKVETYTLADEVEWFINGRSLGKTVPEKAIATIDIPYEKGVVSIIAYKDGAEVGRASLETTSGATHIALIPETDRLIADNRELCYIDISVLDDSERLVPECDSELICDIDGGELMGIFSGDPKAVEHITSNVCRPFEGNAVICLRAKVPGEVKVKVTFNGKEYETAVIAE